MTEPLPPVAVEAKFRQLVGHLARAQAAIAKARHQGVDAAPHTNEPAAGRPRPTRG